MTTTLGLIVNPVAGLGGRVGLKGSDGAEIQRLARQLGAQPQAQSRTIQALRRLEALEPQLSVLTFPGEMGAEACLASGFNPTIVGRITAGATTPEDTMAAAVEMRSRNVPLTLFAGGDGTARDLVNAIGESIPVLGIPAGVKILSAAFATNPAAAGDLARAYLGGQVRQLREAEVLDLDEDAYRAGRVSPRLYGSLRVPDSRRQLQGRKSPSGPDERGRLRAIAQDVIDQMRPDTAYIVGPGTTTRPILTALGLPKTLVGVDVVLGGRLLAADANEASLLGILEAHPARIVVTPIGGQGYLLGRGNAQLSPAVLRAAGGPRNLIVVSPPEKIHDLRGRPLLVDTGDPSLDQDLSGYVRIISGYNERIIYRVAS